MLGSNFDESLFAKSKPWAAAAAFDEFLADGGVCRLTDRVNWVGAAFTCARKADGDPPEAAELAHLLIWAYLAIKIRESLASGFPESESWGIIKGAMWVRINLIVRCGSHPQDDICDCAKVVEWCLKTPQVHQFLKLQPKEIPRYGSLDPEVREVGDMLTGLVAANRLEETSTVADFLAAIRHSRMPLIGVNPTRQP